MANSTSAALLYAEVCKLAYTETHMGLQPRAPFDPGDSDALIQQATLVADIAKDLRSKKPSDLKDDQIAAGLTAVRQAQSYFDYINNTNGKPPAKKVIVAAVAEAVEKIAAL